MNNDDRILFLTETADVKRLPAEQKIIRRINAKPSPGLEVRRAAAQQDVVQQGHLLASAEFVGSIDPWAELSHRRDGIQHGVFKNLRMGKYQFDASLDLHHHTVKQADQAMSEFIHDCHELDLRCLLITHGKGEFRAKPALLKSCVNHWLRQMDEVLAFHSAQNKHGGVGATYVLLRKKPQLDR